MNAVPHFLCRRMWPTERMRAVSSFAMIIDRGDRSVKTDSGSAAAGQGSRAARPLVRWRAGVITGGERCMYVVLHVPIQYSKLAKAGILGVPPHMYPTRQQIVLHIFPRMPYIRTCAPSTNPLLSTIATSATIGSRYTCDSCLTKGPLLGILADPKHAWRGANTASLCIIEGTKKQLSRKMPPRQGPCAQPAFAPSCNVVAHRGMRWVSDPRTAKPLSGRSRGPRRTLPGAARQGSPGPLSVMDSLSGSKSRKRFWDSTFAGGWL
jgi:hypothetical protein